jgi:hypothetical protein
MGLPVMSDTSKVTEALSEPAESSAQQLLVRSSSKSMEIWNGWEKSMALNEGSTAGSPLR